MKKLALALTVLVALVAFAMAHAPPALGETLDRYAAPPIAGHVTDPGGRLSADEKKEIEELLGAIQTDSKVDVAAFIAQVARKDVATAGRTAYAQWGIGRDWESGVLLTLSEDGQGCRLIVAGDASPISPARVAEIETAVGQVAQKGQFVRALRVAAEQIGRVLRTRAKTPLVRPRGERDVPRSLPYGAGALLVAAIAATLSLRRSLKWQRA
jgi:uncharacterized membrane protein YgcG